MPRRSTAPCSLLAARYEVSARIGVGAMAEVYEAIDRRLDRAVAVKVFRVGSADRARFDNEIAFLAGLRHRNVVSVYDAGIHNDAPFVVLELCEQTLAERLASGRLEPSEVARLGAGLGAALDQVHAAGIIHRDLKPSNILIAADGRSLLADFGIARLLDTTRLTGAAVTLGTPAYLAPEQAAGDEVGPPADVYALGLVLIEALTGQRAFEGNQQEVSAARLVRAPHLPATIPARWRPPKQSWCGSASPIRGVGAIRSRPAPA